MRQSERGEIGEMMFEDDRESEAGLSIEVEGAADLVRRVVSAIDSMGTEEHDVLLGDLLCAAWPTPTTQLQ
jgi:hypothetical protein